MVAHYPVLFHLQVARTRRSAAEMRRGALPHSTWPAPWPRSTTTWATWTPWKWTRSANGRCNSKVIRSRSSASFRLFTFNSALTMQKSTSTSAACCAPARSPTTTPTKRMRRRTSSVRAPARRAPPLLRRPRTIDRHNGNVIPSTRFEAPIKLKFKIITSFTVAQTINTWCDMVELNFHFLFSYFFSSIVCNKYFSVSMKRYSKKIDSTLRWLMKIKRCFDNF